MDNTQMNAGTPDSTDTETANVPPKAATATSIPENRSIKYLQSSRKIISRNPQIASENQNAENKENALGAHLEVATSTRQQGSCGTVPEQTVKAKSPSDDIWTSKSLKEHAIHVSPSLKNQSERTHEQKVFKNTSHHHRLESTSKEQPTSDLICNDVQTPTVQMQEVDSLQGFIQIVPDEATKTKYPVSSVGRNFHSHKFNNKYIRSFKTSIPNTNHAAATSRSTNYVDAEENSKLESSSIIRCRSSHQYSVKETQRESSTRLSLEKSKEETITTNCLEQKNNRESDGSQAFDLALATNNVPISTPSNGHRSGPEYATLPAKATINKIRRSHCRPLLHTPKCGIIRSAQPSAGDIHVFTKSSRNLLLHNDIKTPEPQKMHPKSATRSRFIKVLKSPPIDSAQQLNSEANTKLNTENKTEPSSNLCSSGNDLLVAKQSVTPKENKRDELLRSATKVKACIANRLQNMKLGSFVGPRHTQTSNKRFFNSLKRNESKRVAEIEPLDKDKIKASTHRSAAEIEPLDKDKIKASTHRSASSKFLTEDQKRDHNEVVQKYHTKLPSRYLLPNKQKILPAVSRELNNPINSGLPLLVDQRGYRRSIACSSRRANQKVDKAPASSNTRKLDALFGLNVSAEFKDFEKLLSPLCETNLLGSVTSTDSAHSCDTTHLAESSQQEGRIPVICLYWCKREDTPLQEESPDRNGHQCIVSLDQGLSALKQIMTDTTSKNMFCSTEYMLSQCNNADSQAAPCPCPSFDNNSQSGLVSDIYFKLTPRTNAMESTKLPLPEKGTDVCQMKGKARRLNKSFQHDRNILVAAEFMRELSRSSFRCKRSSHGDAFQAYETSVEGVLEGDLTDLDSHNSKGQDLQPFTWHSVSRKIISYFLNSRFKEKIYSLQALATMLESNATEREDQNSSDENSQDVDDIVAQQERITESLLPSKPSRSAIIDFLACLLQGKFNFSSRYSSPEENLSDIATTSTATVISHRGHMAAGNQVITKINGDANENRSRFQEVLNVLFWKHSGENRVVCCKELPSQEIEDKETTEKHRPLADALKGVLKRGITEDDENQQCFDYSQSDNPHIAQLNEDLKKTARKNYNKINADQEGKSNLVNKVTLYMNALSSDVKTIDLVSGVPTNLEKSSINQDVDVSYNSHCNVVVDSNDQMSTRSDSPDHQLSPSSSISPDSSLQFSYVNTASQLAAKLSGFGAAAFKRHPHLVWIMRSLTRHQESDWIKPEPGPFINMPDDQIGIGDRRKQTDLNESLDSIKWHEDCAEFIQDIVSSPNKENTSVERNIAEGARTNSYRYNISSTSEASIDMDKKIYKAKNTNEISCSGVTPKGVFEQPQFTSGSEGESSEDNFENAFDFICAENDTGRREMCTSWFPSKRLSPMSSCANNLQQDIEEIRKRGVASAQIKALCSSQSQKKSSPVEKEAQIRTPSAAHALIENVIGLADIEQKPSNHNCWYSKPESVQDTMCSTMMHEKQNSLDIKLAHKRCLEQIIRLTKEKNKIKNIWTASQSSTAQDSNQNVKYKVSKGTSEIIKRHSISEINSNRTSKAYTARPAKDKGKQPASPSRASPCTRKGQQKETPEISAEINLHQDDCRGEKKTQSCETSVHQDDCRGEQKETTIL